MYGEQGIMRFFWNVQMVPSFIEDMTEEDINNVSYAQLNDRLLADGMSYFDKGWGDALSKNGNEVIFSHSNVKLAQKKWCYENAIDFSKKSMEDILYLQIKKYQPDIFFVGDMCSSEFLSKVRQDIKSIKLIIAWSGSAVGKSTGFKSMLRYVDLVICCAPETVAYLRENGAKCIHINHAFFFDKRYEKIASILRDDITFAGSLIREKNFHLKREKLLLELSRYLKLSIYTPSVDHIKKKVIYSLTKVSIFYVLQNLPIFIRNILLENSQRLKKHYEKDTYSVFPVNFKLLKYCKQSVWGDKFFDVLHNSALVLNIHADSSPMYASNMRIFG